MGVYYEHKLSVLGASSTIREFIDRCIDIGNDDIPIGFAFERIAPTPTDLPDGSAIGRLGQDVNVGVEALTCRPRSSPQTLALGLAPISVLETEGAQDLGLMDHDSLTTWLRENDPAVLEVGRAALSAYERTGEWSRQEWQTANWGGSYEEMDSLVLSFNLWHDSTTELTIRLSTKSVTIHPLIGHVSRIFPSLNLRLVLADDGYNVALIATATNGKILDEYVEITDEFIAEINGEPLEVSNFYVGPSAAKPEPMTHVRFWRSKRRLRSSVIDYPVYSPRFAGYPPALTDEQAEANVRHFLATKDERIGNLKTFLHSFQAAIDNSDQGIKNLDQWIWQYGAFLKVSETGAAYLTHDPIWDGHWRTENVIFDLATFLGQAIVDRYDGYQWEHYTDVPPCLREFDDHYRSMTVWNGEIPSRVWIFDEVRSFCDCLYENSFMWMQPRVVTSPDQQLKSVATNILAKPAARCV
ncbi:hypothetical protein FPV16_00270 [Methylobacterium sp. W2]|uniref:hypothetical protein n=1 Tax=Methylobacterium sp. W2 TaxID=2598107 RepID=UPI001D0C2936|nr:hypothetical protein [Methylobacterium sp. W2]MCC0804668.1 hypothetical protein [Methylobacterium sp. W2]